MTKNAFLIHIHEESNGREHTLPVVLLAENLAEAARCADQTAQNWYGGEDETEDAGVKDGDGWWCANGEVFVTVRRVEQIPIGDYRVLSRYSMALDAIDEGDETEANAELAIS
jgi:hypothetical protein